MQDVTQMLSAIESGDPTAADKLLPLVYSELRRLAEYRLANEKSGQTLQATALVHEAYLRLVGDGVDPQRWNGRGHFYSAAAESMRRILVESARRKNRLKRGGDLARVDLDEAHFVFADVREDLVALDAALTKLADTDRQAAELIQLRYFAGLSLADAARQMEISTRTAERIWRYAKAWLRCEMQESDEIQE